MAMVWNEAVGRCRTDKDADMDGVPPIHPGHYASVKGKQIR